MIRTDGRPTIAMRESDNVLARYNRDLDLLAGHYDGLTGRPRASTRPAYRKGYDLGNARGLMLPKA